MSEIDTTRIKKLFYEKLEKEQTTVEKRTKLKITLLVAAILSMTSFGVLAANTSLFDRLFINLGDIAEYIQIADESVTSNGITMSLTGYLADNMGIVPQITFTREDGGIFLADTRVSGPSRGIWDTRWMGQMLRPDVKVNDVQRFPQSQIIVSNDGNTLYVFPITHYDIEVANSVLLELAVDRLIYNFEEHQEVVYFDFYGVYQNSNVMTMYSTQHLCVDELIRMFDYATDVSYQAEIGTVISSVAFAKVIVESAEELPEGVDGIDMAGLQPGNNYIVAFRYTHKKVEGNREYHFWPGWPQVLINSTDPFGMETSGNLDDETVYLYRFVRVSSFDDLTNMGGINFIIGSNNFIEGDWSIRTRFAANHESTVLEVNKINETKNPETTLNLTNIDISLFSTRLTYEIRDLNGNLLSFLDIPFYTFNEYYLDTLHQPIQLRFADGKQIDILDSASWVDECGTMHVSYNMEFNQESFTLMNTGKLEAIVIGGQEFVLD